MQLLLAIMFLGLTVQTTFAKSHDKRASFTSLSDALKFVDTELDNQDWAGLKSAVFERPVENEVYQKALYQWKYLREIRGKTRLAEAGYSKRFPVAPGDPYYNLGDYYSVDVLDNRVRISFTKSGGGWNIEKIGFTK